MNAERFTNFLAEVRIKLDPKDEIMFIYDGTPADNSPIIPANKKIVLKKLSLYSPDLNSVEQAISDLQAAIKNRNSSLYEQQG